MALQDLTPQLRTRLSRMERAVGWFVIFATVLFLFGIGYYLYNTAENKGWFKTKIRYQTSISTGAGLKVGNPVKLMGFDVGEITAIIPNDPYAAYNITVEFRIIKPNYGYIWSDSKVRVAAGDLLGNRYLEVIKGSAGVPTVHENQKGRANGILLRSRVEERLKEWAPRFTNQLSLLQAIDADARTNFHWYYTNLAAGPYWLDPLESPSVTERLETVVNQVQSALPNILDLTNKLGAVLDNSAKLTAHLADVAANARPAVSNLALATARLDQPGGLGEWLLPTNISQKLDTVLGGAGTLMDTANTNLENLDLTLISLANLTRNLNQQVQANPAMLGSISKTVVDTDDLVQGLKRHWLLRSAFKTKKTNAPAPPIKSPKAAVH